MYRWFLNGDDITSLDPSWATSDRIVIDLTAECGSTTIRVVVDDGRCIAEDETVVDVDRKPVASIRSLSVGACDMTLVFDGTTSTDCNGAALAYSWDFDSDGRIDSTEPAGTFRYSRCGPLLVSLIVADGECLSEPARQAVHVNEPPSASLLLAPEGCLMLGWTTSATDCDLTRPSTLYTESLSGWLDFGDGSPVSSEVSGAHLYAECGTYVLTFTVTDASGCLAVDDREVTLTGSVTVE